MPGKPVRFSRSFVWPLWCFSVCLLIYTIIALLFISRHTASRSVSGSIDELSRKVLRAQQHMMGLNVDATSSGSEAWQTTLRYFPQARRCQARGWLQEYADLHRDISQGKRPGRWLISVGVAKGAADRLSGLVTLFWMAVLSQRALYETTVFPPVRGFAAACNGPFFNWTALPNTANVPQAAITPFSGWLDQQWHYSDPNSYDGSAVNTSLYHPFRMASSIASPMYSTFFGETNFSDFPKVNPGIPYIVGNNNRGRSYLVATNPHYKDQFVRHGVAPVDAFMCGFFALCSPTAAVQQKYMKFWEVLQEPGVLSIGIQIRTGDQSMWGATNIEQGKGMLQQYKSFFTCAEGVEATYAAVGQKVIWYLNSDSLSLRQAAQQEYGTKLLTDTVTQTTHVDCGGCDATRADAAMQDAVGAMLTFSMVNYHIITVYSGFGRVPAWISGRSQHLFEMNTELPEQQCNPKQTLTRDAASSMHWAGV